MTRPILKTFSYIVRIVTLLALFLPRVVPAQPMGSDAAPALAVRADSLLQRSWEIIYSNPDSALLLAREAMELSRAAGYAEGMMTAQTIRGIAYDVVSLYDSALKYYHDALALSKQNDDTYRMANSYSNIGLTHWHIGNYRDALEYLFLALEYFDGLGRELEMAHVNNNIGLIYADLSSDTRARKYFDRALGLYLRLGNRQGTAAVLTNLGILVAREDLDSGMMLVDSSITMKLALNDLYGLSIAYNELARIHLRKEEYARARADAIRSLGYSAALDDLHESANAWFTLEQVHFVGGNLDSALHYTRKALGAGEATGSKKILYKAYERLSEIHEAQGDERQALETYKTSVKLRDEVISDERLNQVYDVELRYETEKKAGEIALLNRQKSIQQLQIEKQQLLISRRNTLLIAIVVLFPVILLVGYLLYLNSRQRQRMQMEKALLEMREKRSREVIEAEIRERKRIGEELHDSLGQILSLIKLNLTNLIGKKDTNGRANAEPLRGVVELVDTAFRDVRQISHNMAPILLSDKGLVGAVRDLLDRIKASGRFRVTFELAGSNGRLEPYLEHTLFRAVQECLNNIITHAAATEISVQMVYGDSDLNIMIEDNGRGFDPAEVEKKDGIGLKSSVSRIESIGGTMLIDAAPGRGTIITIITPLKSETT